jgi:DNA-binding NarL/FixJ family response regulator
MEKAVSMQKKICSFRERGYSMDDIKNELKIPKSILVRVIKEFNPTLLDNPQTIVNKKKITAEMSRIKKMRRDGFSYKEIAKTIDVPKSALKTYLENTVEEDGHSLYDGKSKSPEYIKTRDNKILNYAKRGWSYKEIAEETGLSSSEVGRIISKYGSFKREKGRMIFIERENEDTTGDSDSQE